MQGHCSCSTSQLAPCSGGPSARPPVPGFPHGAWLGFCHGGPGTGDLNLLQACSVFHQPAGALPARAPGAAERGRGPGPERCLTRPRPGVRSGPLPRGLGTCTWSDGASALVLPACPRKNNYPKSIASSSKINSLCISWAPQWDSKSAPGQFRAIRICCKWKFWTIHAAITPYNCGEVTAIITIFFFIPESDWHSFASTLCCTLVPHPRQDHEDVLFFSRFKQPLQPQGYFRGNDFSCRQLHRRG